MVFALGLWGALSPNLLGRFGASRSAFRARSSSKSVSARRRVCKTRWCEHISWHPDAHSLTSAVFRLAAPILLAFAFRRVPGWRDAWLPTLAAIPASIAATVLFSLLGDGAANRAGAITWLLWLAYVAFQLLRKGDPRRDRVLVR